MSENEKYQKINLQAVMDALQPVFRPSVKVAVMQRANGVFILIDYFRIDTDSLISISLALFGLHDALDVSSFCIYDELHEKYHLCLEGVLYKILPKFYDGQTLVGKKPFVLERDSYE